MSDTIPFRCPSCGAQHFRVGREGKTYNDFLGANCSGCGRTVTDEDVRSKIRQVTVDELKKALER